MPYPLDFRISGPELTLRAPSEADIPIIFAATRYPGFNDGMVWDPPKNMDELRPNLAAHLEAWKKGEAFGFAIEDTQSGKFLGRISLRPTQDRGSWDVGYWTHPEMQGRGIMTQSVSMVIGFAFKELHARELVAAYAVWNKASQKVLEKNGFIYLKHVPKGFKKKGKWVEENLMIRRRKPSDG